MQGLFEEDFNRIPTSFLDKDLYKFMQGPLGEDFTRMSTRSYHKDLCKTMQGPLRGCQQDLHRIFS